MSTDQPQKLRTWSAFGQIRRRPSEYEIGTHATNYTLRGGRFAPLEQNTSSPGNLWISTYRDGSPLRADDWDAFRDPDTMTYRTYVAAQNAQEVRVAGLLDTYADAGHDAGLPSSWIQALGLVFTPTRYVAHGIQMVQSYVATLAPSAYIGNAASFAAADQLRRNTLVSYRTRQLQMSYPDAGFVTGERAVWEGHEAWQPAREAMERALTAYDWGEAFTAVNLVIGPTLDDVLLRQVGAAARVSDDDLTWQLNTSLLRDSQRRDRWSAALVRMALQQRPETRAAVDRWVTKWAPRADAAARSVGTLTGDGEAAGEQARETRGRLLDAAGLGTPADLPS